MTAFEQAAAKPVAAVSPRTLARVAGGLYLVNIVAGALAATPRCSIARKLTAPTIG